MPAARFSGRPYDLDFIKNLGWVQLQVITSATPSVGGLFIKDPRQVDEVARAMGAQHDVDGTYDDQSKDVITLSFGSPSPNWPKRPQPNDWIVALVEEVAGRLRLTLKKGTGQTLVASLDSLAGPIARLAQQSGEPVEVSFAGTQPEEITRMKVNRS